jgi:hypothetical protein
MSESCTACHAHRIPSKAAQQAMLPPISSHTMPVASTRGGECQYPLAFVERESFGRQALTKRRPPQKTITDDLRTTTSELVAKLDPAWSAMLTIPTIVGHSMSGTSQEQEIHVLFWQTVRNQRIGSRRRLSRNGQTVAVRTFLLRNWIKTENPRLIRAYSDNETFDQHHSLLF